MTARETGELGEAPWRSQWAVVPPWIELDGDVLRYRWQDPQDTTAAEAMRDPRGMLEAFIRIRSEQDVLRFARRYGVLELCRHKLPASHNPPSFPRSHGKSGCYPLGMLDGKHWEPVSVWLGFANRMRGVVAVAADLHYEGRPGRTEDWALATGRNLAPRTVGTGRQNLSNLVNEFLMLGGHPMLAFSWARKEPSVIVTAGTFGLIALQLVAAIRRNHSLAICSECGQPYTVRRKPQVGRRNYCSGPECRRAVERDRKRRSRAKARKEADNGTTRKQ